MKKLSLYIVIFLSWFNIGLADIQGVKYLYCDVKDHDPDWFKPKNFAFKIDYNRTNNLGKSYFYLMDGVQIPDWEKFPSGFQLVNSETYHIYSLVADNARAYDMFADFKEMKLYINLYEKNGIFHERAKKFVSTCKFVKK